MNRCYTSQKKCKAIFTSSVDNKKHRHARSVAAETKAKPPVPCGNRGESTTWHVANEPGISGQPCGQHSRSCSEGDQAPLYAAPEKAFGSREDVELCRSRTCKQRRSHIYISLSTVYTPLIILSIPLKTLISEPLLGASKLHLFQVLRETTLPAGLSLD